ncbi:MAG TPA: hypothetical protein VNO21_25205 [Polyangiaceae bacterium]|nr:hypothetical protein [Polyangiaceae bacterium]
MGKEDSKQRATAFSQRYDAGDEIIHVSYPGGFHLETREDITEMFDAVVGFWRARCAGQRVYYVVDYTNYSSNLAHNDFYVKQVKRVIAECAITIVRFGGDPLTRTGSRLRGMKLHVPTNLYATKSEALTVVRALREGRMSLAP